MWPFRNRRLFVRFLPEVCLGSQTSGCGGGLAGWLLDFFWKNNSLRSDIFFRQKIQQPPRADGHWRVHGLKDVECKTTLHPARFMVPSIPENCPPSVFCF